MDLATWTSIPEERQHQLIVGWCKDNQWDEYEDMAIEAAAALKEKLAPIPGITNVEIGGGRVLCAEPANQARELILNVCTLLPDRSRLDQIPPRFAGFRVHQLNLGDKREAFLRTWKRLFKELKGWDEETTTTWAEKWDDALSGRQPSAVYHYGPVKLALSSLVGDAAKTAAGERLQMLYDEMRNVIERTESVDSPRIEHPDAVENYDWEYVRKRVAELIRKYGEELDE